MEPIQTSFGAIRPYSITDAPAMARHANNPRIALCLRDGFPHPYTLADAEAFLGRVLPKDPITFAAITVADEVIGGIGILIGSDVHRRTAELGYWLAEPYWGRGYMSETVRLFIDDCFRRFDLVRVHADPYDDNVASARVLEKAGFVLEGHMRGSVLKAGVIKGQLMYALVRLPTA